MKPPRIIFLTESGRFEIGVPICLSITSHHRETWQPSWDIRLLMTALQVWRSHFSISLAAQLNTKTTRRRALWKLLRWGRLGALTHYPRSVLSQYFCLPAFLRKRTESAKQPLLSNVKSSTGRNVSCSQPDPGRFQATFPSFVDLKHMPKLSGASTSLVLVP